MRFGATGQNHQYTREAAWTEFYEYLPGFAFQCPEPVYRKIIADLVSNIGMAEVEKMGCSLNQADRNKFLTDAQQAEDDRKRASQKRGRRHIGHPNGSSHVCPDRGKT